MTVTVINCKATVFFTLLLALFYHLGDAIGLLLICRIFLFYPVRCIVFTCFAFAHSLPFRTRWAMIGCTSICLFLFWVLNLYSSIVWLCHYFDSWINRVVAFEICVALSSYCRFIISWLHYNTCWRQWIVPHTTSVISCLLLNRIVKVNNTVHTTNLSIELNHWHLNHSKTSIEPTRHQTKKKRERWTQQFNEVSCYRFNMCI